MRKLLLAAVSATVLASGAAFAADLPSRQAPAAYAAPMPVYAYSWTGFYVGAQVGYGWQHNRVNTFAPASSFTFNNDGFLGGVHAGYNQQFGSIVAGLEGDIEYRGGRGSVVPGAFAYRANNDWQGSLRARLGYAFDRTMIYATGGVAFANLENRVTGAGGTENFSNTKAGWTLGGGIEHALTNNWTVRAEYRYTDYGRQNFASAVAVPGMTASNKVTDNTVRLGISYKFGGPSGPVVAKY